MRGDWWSLSGPAQLVTGILSQFRAGKNVALRLPAQFPAGLRAAVRRELSDSKEFLWRTLGPSISDGLHPLDVLWNEFLVDRDPGAIRDLNGLVHAPSFQGQLLWIDGFEMTQWAGWLRFLDEYSHACRGTSLVERTVMCVVVPPEADKGPKEDVAMSVIEPGGYCSRLDMLVYSSRLLGAARPYDLRGRIVALILAELALWDPDVCDSLAVEPFEVVLSPVGALEAWAARNGATSATDGDARRRGFVQKIDGQEETHSGLLAARGDLRIIETRVWRGEIAVLMPFLEECRQRILDATRGLVRLPFITRFGEVITDACDLELGQIEAALPPAVVPRDFYRLVSVLRKMRNLLAHMKPVGTDLLDSEPIRHIDRILKPLR